MCTANHNHFSWVRQIKTYVEQHPKLVQVLRLQGEDVWSVFRSIVQLCSTAFPHHRNVGGACFTSVCASWQSCLFYYKGRLHFYKRWLSFLAGSVSPSIYQTRLSKTKNYTFPHSFNKSHLSNVIVSRISITVNIFFYTAVLTFYITCTRDVITSMTCLE